MTGRLLWVWEQVRGSLWALPLAIAAACAGLAILTLNLNLPWTSEAAWLYSGSARQAPQFAASLVGAMITLTSLAFSITMVVLTLAAQQLGPRLIQIFMGDRGTKFALGLFLGTVVYLLLVLRALDADDTGHAPNLAITGGTALVLASVVTLLFFVHALARSIVADHVIARVGDALDHAIERAFPETPEADAPPSPPAAKGAPISLSARGYVQRIDYDALAKAAQRRDVQIVLAYHAGAHILHGETDAWITGSSPEELRDALQQAIVVSSQRAGGQDPEWSARQLVEIALRALSPGINDEFTALAVIDRLALSIALLMRRADPGEVWRDDTGAARIFGPRPAAAIMIHGAFAQIIESSFGKTEVLSRLEETLQKLRVFAPARCREPLSVLQERIERVRGCIQTTSTPQ